MNAAHGASRVVCLADQGQALKGAKEFDDTI
jgi:hypothetical protein